MAKKTIKQTDAATDVKKAAPAKKAATSEPKVTKPRATRIPKAPAFVPPTAEEIAVRAYFRAMERGFAPGDAREDWLAAEAELIAWRKGAGSAAAPAGKGTSRKRVERAAGIEP